MYSLSSLQWLSKTRKPVVTGGKRPLYEGFKKIIVIFGMIISGEENLELLYSRCYNVHRSRRLHYTNLKKCAYRLMSLSLLLQLQLAYTADLCDITQPSQKTHSVDKEG